MWGNAATQYHWILKVFWNTNEVFSTTSGFASAWWTYLWVSAWALDNTWSYDETWVVQPDVWTWNYLTKWKQAVSLNENTTYTFGSNIPNQVRPIKFNGSSFEFYGIDGIDYDSTKKIGQW